MYWFTNWVWVRILYYDRRSFGQSVLGQSNRLRAKDHIFITVRHLRVRWYGALSLMRGRVCHLQMLLALANALIFGSDSHRTRENILPYQIRDFPFRRLLRLAELRWRYSNPPPHRNLTSCLITNWTTLTLYILSAGTTHRKHSCSTVACVSVGVPTWPLLSPSIGVLAAAY
jgi:hypothetical protein